jgi:putative hydrolase of the HAD superfamily
MRERFDVVLFDLGGTLVDEDDVLGWATLGRSVGLELDPDLLRHAFQEVTAEHDRSPYGPRQNPATRVEFWRRVLARVLERDVDTPTAARYVEAKERGPEPHYTVYSDVRRCLDALVDGRRRLGVVSNSDNEASARRILKLTGIEPYFEAVVSSGTEGVAKPDPEIFRRAVARMGVPPARAFFVGNLEHTDAIAARHAGLGSVWLNREGTGFTDGTPEITSLLEVPVVLEELEGPARPETPEPASHA